jgi:DNA-binding transcriptional ArsR family regulator
MVASKTALFDPELQVRSNLFKLLAHPARLRILLYLAETKNCLSGDISDMFPISRTTVNQHMNDLKDAGLIIGEERESKMVYCLNVPKMQEMTEILERFTDDTRIPQGFCCMYKPRK